MDKEHEFSQKNKELPKGLLVWWLTEEEQEQITPEQWLRVPIYIKNELSALEGRQRRGRLWVPKDIDVEEIHWDDKHPNAQRLGRSGGIVFHDSDKEALVELPGLITDLKLDTQTQEKSTAKESPKEETERLVKGFEEMAREIYQANAAKIYLVELEKNPSLITWDQRRRLFDACAVGMRVNPEGCKEYRQFMDFEKRLGNLFKENKS